ncbi:MAG TPA: hypothetical protein VNT75_06990, partial [Symbiobacteriaceae bacterium]|nr:hypothetical protein [Symbiobacteriaceae bacterium]
MVQRQPRKQKAGPSRRHTRWIVLGGAGLWGALAAAGLSGVWPTVAVVLGTGAVALANRFSGRKAPVRRPRKVSGQKPVVRESDSAPRRPNAVTEAYNTLPRTQAKPKPLAPAPVLRAP